MGYLHISNLYKEQDIMLFKRCFALEKIHGSSSHVAWKDGEIRFHSGGAKHETFVAIFNEDALIEYAKSTGLDQFVIYGEVYGGSMQAMRETYGDKLKFVCFDVKIDRCWLTAAQAERFCIHAGFEFVDYA